MIPVYFEATTSSPIALLLNSILPIFIAVAVALLIAKLFGFTLVRKRKQAKLRGLQGDGFAPDGYNNTYQEDFNLVLETGGVSVWIFDIKKQMFNSLHGNALASTGITMEENLKMLHSDDNRCQQELFDTMISGKVNKAERIFRYVDNALGYRYYKSHMIVRKENGIVSHILGTQKEVTDEIQRNRQLKETIRQNEIIMANINLGLVYIDTNYKVMWENIDKTLNAGAETECKLYKKGEYCYKSHKGLDAPCQDCVMTKALLSGKEECKQSTLPNGDVYEIYATPVINEDEKVDGVILRMENITERSKLYSDLHESNTRNIASNQLLNEILEKLPGIMTIIDASDNFKYIKGNKLLYKYLGKTEEEVIGKTDFELFDTEVAKHNRSFDERAINEKNTIEAEFETLNKKNEKLFFHVSKSPITTIDGHKLIIGMATDVTKFHSVNIELQEAIAKAEESDRLKSAFLANMSHEIRTPLNAIVGFSDLLINTDDQSEKEEYIRIINTNNELLLRLIGDILDLSKIESGTVEMKRERLDLVSLFEEFSLSLKQKITNPNVRFIEVSPYSKCIVSLDRDRLAQVLTNFGTNAIKFTSKGHIKMGYEYINNGIRVYVEDTGIGIPIGKHSSIFQRFEKLNSFAQGTGLGLSICKAIIDTSKGEIGFESEEGKGSTFWAWIPCKAEIEESGTLENKETIPTESASITIQPNKENHSRSYSILVAEDNDSNYLLIKAVLKKQRLTRTINGVEAVKMAQEKQYDAILMDMRMPLMGGLEATKKIREFDNRIPIIAVTANSYDSDRVNALEAGCTGFVPKPVSSRELINTLDSLIEKSHLLPPANTSISLGNPG